MAEDEGKVPGASERLCAACGYGLAGQREASGVCPECGGAFPPFAVVASGSPPSRRSVRGGVICLVLAAACGAGIPQSLRAPSDLVGVCYAWSIVLGLALGYGGIVLLLGPGRWWVLSWAARFAGAAVILQLFSMLSFVFFRPPIE